MIKCIDSITNISDLGLSKRHQKILKDYNPREVVIAARLGELTRFAGVGSTKAAKITQELRDSGYIYEESSQFWGVRRLLVKVGVIKNFNSTKEYEARAEFMPEQISSLRNILETTLTQREANILTLRFGLSGETPLTLNECGQQYNNLSRNWIQQIEWKALRKLHHPSRKSRLYEAFPEFNNTTQIFEKSYNPLDDTPIDELGLPEHICDCLRLDYITRFGQLRRYRRSDLLRICGLDKTSVAIIQDVLLLLDVSLEE